MVYKQLHFIILFALNIKKYLGFYASKLNPQSHTPLYTITSKSYIGYRYILNTTHQIYRRLMSRPTWGL